MAKASQKELTVDLSEDFVKKIAEINGEDEKFLERRLHALKLVGSFQYPEVKGLDLSKYEPWNLLFPITDQRTPTPLSQEVQNLAKGNKSVLAQIDTQRVVNKLSPQTTKEGVLLLPLDEAMREHRDLVLRYMGRLIPPEDHRLSAVIHAFRSGGFFLFVPKGVVVDEPIYLHLRLKKKGEAFFSHSIVVLEDNSQANLIYQVTSSPDLEGSLMDLQEIYIGMNSRVTLEFLQAVDSKTRIVSFRKTVQDEGSYLKDTTVWLGGKSSYSVWQNLLKGNESELENTSIHFATGEESFDFFHTTNHRGPRTRSNIQTRGVLRDKGKSLFSGMVRVEKEAQFADSLLSNHSLLLNPGAATKAIPGLEILANEVRVTHSASVTEVNQDNIFYLTSRGISEDEATRLIVKGFLTPALEKIPLQGLKDEIDRMIDVKFES